MFCGRLNNDPLGDEFIQAGKGMTCEGKGQACCLTGPGFSRSLFRMNIWLEC